MSSTKSLLLVLVCFNNLNFPHQIIKFSKTKTRTRKQACTLKYCAHTHVLQTRIFIKQRNQLYESSPAVTTLTVHCRAHIVLEESCILDLISRQNHDGQFKLHYRPDKFVWWAETVRKKRACTQFKLFVKLMSRTKSTLLNTYMIFKDCLKFKYMLDSIIWTHNRTLSTLYRVMN
jgi:hypothetical protein